MQTLTNKSITVYSPISTKIKSYIEGKQVLNNAL